MAGYTLNSAGSYVSTLVGGNITPGMPSFSVGDLLVMHTGINSISNSSPVIPGWTKISLNSNAPGDSMFARLAQIGDISPTFQWDASHQSFARIISFSGDVYPDLATIVDPASNDSGTNTTGRIQVASTGAPSVPNCLTIRCGHCVKTATNNGSTFADWNVNSGIYTKIGNTQVVQNGSALAAAIWYNLQSSPASTSLDTSSLTNVDTSANSQGMTMFLKPFVIPTNVIPSRLIFILP